MEYDPATSIWDIVLLKLRWHSFHRYQYFGELSSNEFASQVSRLGLKFLAQDFYAKAVWDEYFDA
ncbi:hypothetical protein [Mycetocola sp.]|uniref:hypothetical protein n=1 Tax=Mycetocola sp. TaxID=1871042 RepID=UPI0039898D28